LKKKKYSNKKDKMPVFRVKDMDIATGDVRIAILNKKDAQILDLFHLDRLYIKKNNKKTTAILDIAESEKAVPPGSIGLFEETLAAINAKHNDKVEISLAPKPKGLEYIRNKIKGKKLNHNEITTIIKDITKKRLTDVELTSFVIANYIREMSLKEVISTTKAMSATGTILKFKKHPVVDKHCIGGIPGNRTSLIIVPILVAAGASFPKTSSRAITSPAGTADTMEALCPVKLTIPKLKKTIADVGGFIVWGGAMNLAPADDAIIKVENAINITSEGNMIASIMAKKISVSPDYLLIDIPIGKETKIADKETAVKLKRKISRIGKYFGIKVKTMISDGSQPIGRGIGPVLEAKDCLMILKNNPNAPEDLKQKSLKMAGMLLEFCGKAKKGKGKKTAERLLKTGAAYGAMVRIIEAQGGKEITPEQLPKAPLTKKIKAEKTGTIESISNQAIAKIARLAGAPKTKTAGIELLKHKKDKVKKGETLIIIHAKSKDKLQYTLKAFKETNPIKIK